MNNNCKYTKTNSYKHSSFFFLSSILFFFITHITISKLTFLPTWEFRDLTCLTFPRPFLTCVTWTSSHCRVVCMAFMWCTIWFTMILLRVDKVWWFAYYFLFILHVALLLWFSLTYFLLLMGLYVVIMTCVLIVWIIFFPSLHLIHQCFSTAMC